MTGIMNVLLGAARIGELTLPAGPINAIGFAYDSGTATATFEMNTAGTYTGSDELDGTPETGDWINPKAGMASYEVRATLSSGDTPTSGTLNSWLSLGTTRSWTLVQSGTGTKSNTILIEVGYLGTSSALDSFSVDMAAQSSALPPP